MSSPQSKAFLGKSLDQAISQLRNRTYAQQLKDFESSVPKILPPLALPIASFIDADKPYTQTVIVSQKDGFAELSVVVANVGTNISVIRMLCLRSWKQVDCNSDGTILKITLPPHSMAVVPLRMRVSTGDFLLFVLSADDDYKRVAPASQRLFAFVDKIILPTQKSEITLLPSSPQLLGGCNFSILLPELPRNNIYRNPGQHKNSKPLFLLTQLCKSDPDQLLRFVPIIDGKRLALLQDTPFESWIHLSSLSNITEIDVSELSNSQKLQFVVVSIDKHGDIGVLGDTRFTAAAKLSP